MLRAGLRAIDPSVFRLVLGDADLGGLEALAPDTVGVGGVLGDLNRATRPFARRLSAPWAVLRVPGLTGGFRFDAEDSKTAAWYPQGVTSGTFEGRELILVSWYRKVESSLARVSVVDVAAGRYRHVLLVDARLAPIHTHAGGIAWWRDRLFVADTTVGLRVFDVERILRAELHGHHYALPQSRLYRRAGAPLRFSFVSLDRAAPGLLVGEYRNGEGGAPLVRWALGDDGLLAGPAATAAWETANSNLQGAVALGDRMLQAQSRGDKQPGRLHVSPYAESVRSHPWALGCEDLCLDATGAVLSVTEHPDARWAPRGLRAVFRAAAP